MGFASLVAQMAVCIFLALFLRFLLHFLLHFLLRNVRHGQLSDASLTDYLFEKQNNELKIQIG
ncbi:hypothetical protein WH50_16025 [Pokkaliibacter plantistimulans]|uniref:Uncharacterized protein n=1 Tax=Pokkaliibacter plantistimulans TaxID=1635171 RepID=A0ABX5M063_9GAMM|nr:hypothetical protein WH50_16025 [Pokkaliibacter plantistimulans]